MIENVWSTCLMMLMPLLRKADDETHRREEMAE